jgi:hypothetical protein
LYARDLTVCDALLVAKQWASERTLADALPKRQQKSPQIRDLRA